MQTDRKDMLIITMKQEVLVLGEFLYKTVGIGRSDGILNITFLSLEDEQLKSSL